MSDFSYLQNLEVSATRTSRMTLHEIRGEPTLILKPATEANKPYFNSVLKRSRKYGRAIQAGNMTPGIIAENREEDRELYPSHIVAGWEGVVDSGNKPVKFSEAACRSFLKALPDWLFDNIRMYAATPSNFVNDEEPIDVEEVAKNSSSA